jgi:hypothetical protein
MLLLMLVLGGVPPQGADGERGLEPEAQQADELRNLD